MGRLDAPVDDYRFTFELAVMEFAVRKFDGVKRGRRVGEEIRGGGQGCCRTRS